MANDNPLNFSIQNASGGGGGGDGTVTSVGVSSSSLTLTGTNPVTTSGTINIELPSDEITIGTTNITLGSTATTLTGLTSVISTGFTGALTGNASTATSATTATNIAGGAAHELIVQTGTGATSFITAPSTSSTYLEWNGSAFVWGTPSGGGSGTVTSVSVSSSTLGVTGTPITTSGTIDVELNNTSLPAIGVPIFVPTALTATAINAAAAAASAAGGGIVQLPAGTISISASLNILAGVIYNGAGYQLSSTSTLIGGTIIAPTGAFPAFAGNATDLGSPYGSAALLTASSIFGCGVRNLATSGGTYGIKIGALYQGGPWSGRFSNLCHVGATVWGAYYENMEQCSFEDIQCYLNANGMCLMGSGTTLYNMGNSTLRKVTANGTAGANGSGRGLLVGSRLGSELNAITVFDYSGSGSTSTSTQACTMAAPIATTITSGSASISATNTFSAGDPVGFSATVGTSGGQVVVGTTYYVLATGLTGSAFEVSATVGGSAITFNASGTPTVYTSKFGVTDLSKFGVGMPVFFSATANGLTINIIYFVNYVSGTTGSGTITVTKFMGGGGGNVAIPMTGNTAVNITTEGWPVLEVGGQDSGSIVTWSSIKGASDIENGGTAHIVFQGNFGLDFEGGTIHSAGSKADICIRNTQAGQGIRLWIPQSVNIDFDSTAQKVQVFGIQPSSVSANYTGVGFTVNSSSGFGQVNLVGTSTPDIIANSNFFNQIQMQNGFALKHSTATTGNTLTTTNGNLVTFITTAGGTLTLPSLTSVNMVGWDLWVSNPQANSVTVSAAQNIIGNGTSGTSITLAAETNVVFKAHNNNGTMIWALYDLPTQGGSGLTSVGLADTSTTPIYTVSGSPLTSNGTIDIALQTQSANTIFAGPTTGSAAQPTFRAITAADIPSNAVAAGTGIGIATVGSTTTFSNTGVTSLAGTTSQITASGSTGAVTLSLPSTVSGLTSVTSTTFVGALTGNATSATNLASGAAGSLPYQTGSGATSLLGIGTAGQVLMTNSGATAPVWTGFKFTLTMELQAGDNGQYYYMLAANFPFVINAAYYQTVSGTITGDVKINTTAVTGLSALALTSTVANTSATGANTVASGNSVSVTFTSNATATYPVVSLQCTRTG